MGPNQEGLRTRIGSRLAGANNKPHGRGDEMPKSRKERSYNTKSTKRRCVMVADQSLSQAEQSESSTDSCADSTGHGTRCAPEDFHEYDEQNSEHSDDPLLKDHLPGHMAATQFKGTVQQARFPGARMHEPGMLETKAGLSQMATIRPRIQFH